MRKRDRKELGRYIRHIADEIGLRDWTVHLEIGNPDLPARHDGQVPIASCESIAGRKAAAITVEPWARQAPLEDLRETIVHELVHCHLFGMQDQVLSDLLGPLGQQAYDTFTGSFMRNLEYATDALAEAIAPRMPLIEWP